MKERFNQDYAASVTRLTRVCLLLLPPAAAACCCSWNMVVQVQRKNKPRGQHPPAIWKDRKDGERLAMARRWFWTHVDTRQAQPSYMVRNDHYFDRLVTGVSILAGRWFKGVTPEALVKLLSGRDVTIAAITTSTGTTLKQELARKGYPRKRRPGWQCSQCGVYVSSSTYKTRQTNMPPNQPGLRIKCAGIKRIKRTAGIKRRNKRP